MSRGTKAEDRCEPMNILTVDDNSTNLNLLRAQLEGEGHTVWPAHDGVEALAVLSHQPKAGPGRRSRRSAAIIRP